MNDFKIFQFGNPNLTKVASPLQATKIKNKENQRLIKGLINFVEKKAITHITAPQVGVAKRIIIIGSKGLKSLQSSQKRPFLVIINPWIMEKSEKKISDWEKCYSINENKLRAMVPRYEWIKIGGFNEKGKRITITAKGLKARLIQHSIDHLNGLFFFAKMKKKDLLKLPKWLKLKSKILQSEKS